MYLREREGVFLGVFLCVFFVYLVGGVLEGGGGGGKHKNKPFSSDIAQSSTWSALLVA